MKRQRGFSLIDLMVGLFVGLLVALAVYATSTVVGAQRRAAVSGNGALEAGMSGIHAMQHDIKAAGVGVWLGGQILCPTINIYHDGLIADGIAVAPVVIDAGAATTDSDSITIAYSDSVLANNGAALSGGMPTAAAKLRVGNPRGIAVNDFVIVGNPGTATPCTLMQVTAKTDSGFGWDLAHAAGTWNPADPGAAFTIAPAYPAGSMVYDVGQFNWVTYRVRDANLEMVDLITGAVDVVANDIVQMKAYYGTTNGSTAQIEQWVPAADAWAAPLDAAHVGAIRAVRVSVVARSQHPEKPSIVGGGCDATRAAPVSWDGGPLIDLAGDEDWRCYKYRTLTLVAPLKNVIFGAGAS